MKMRAFGFFVALTGLFAACSPPKYAHYKSVSGDFTAYVPWGWNVIADADRDAFSQVNFIGPFDPDFYLGAPSLSVRWYKRYRPHQMRDGRLEMYSDAQDFIRQMIHDVYGEKSVLYGIGTREDGGREIIKAPEDIVLTESQLTAKYFGILSPTPARAGVQWGVSKDSQGHRVNIRLHDYAVVTVGDGFYVFCYPATLRGHDKGFEYFRALINTFHPYFAGPGGPKFLIRREAGKS